MLLSAIMVESMGPYNAASDYTLNLFILMKVLLHNTEPSWAALINVCALVEFTTCVLKSEYHLRPQIKDSH